MNEIFIKSIYKSIVEENKYLYENLLDNTDIDKANDEYWKNALKLYNNLSEENKVVLINIMQQTMIDTISNMLGIIDGSSTLSECDAEPKLYLNDVYTDGELQDLFLEYVEEIEE
ncbi:MAG: transposase [Clostridium sp.]|nr:transposase [Clostridium sp.]